MKGKEMKGRDGRGRDGRGNERGRNVELYHLLWVIEPLLVNIINEWMNIMNCDGQKLTKKLPTNSVFS